MDHLKPSTVALGCEGGELGDVRVSPVPALQLVVCAALITALQPTWRPTSLEYTDSGGGDAPRHAVVSEDGAD